MYVAKKDTLIQLLNLDRHLHKKQYFQSFPFHFSIYIFDKYNIFKDKNLIIIFH
jgi:hypothetical protein